MQGYYISRMQIPMRYVNEWRRVWLRLAFCDWYWKTDRNDTLGLLYFIGPADIATLIHYTRALLHWQAHIGAISCCACIATYTAGTHKCMGVTFRHIAKKFWGLQFLRIPGFCYSLENFIPKFLSKVGSYMANYSLLLQLQISVTWTRIQLVIDYYVIAS